ncbi:helix-turn-helix domain-containing protein [Terrabacter sp. AAH1]
MAKISIAEAAGRLDVNVQRVHQRIADGSLPAERVGHQWVVDEADLGRLANRPAGRPLSPQSALDVALVGMVDELDLPRSQHSRGYASQSQQEAVDFARWLLQRHSGPAAGDVVAPISPSRRSRARARLRHLLAKALEDGASEDREAAAGRVAGAARSLMHSRARRELYRAAPRDLEDLRHDGRLVLAGVSLPESGLTSGDVVEAYVSSSRLDSLVNEFLLVDASESDANVILHVHDMPGGPDFVWPANSWVALAADLAEHARPREMARAADIVMDVARRDAAVSARAKA